jgi:hypothetical protein
MIRGVLIAVGLAALGGCSQGHDTTFIALDRDFIGFTNWRRSDLGSDPIAGHPSGPRFGYLNRPVAQGTTHYPLGPIIVKTIGSDPDPTTWEIFAMAKRGGDFNAEGARDWEFFRLRWVADGPHIVSRGRTAVDPEDGGSGYTGSLDSAFGEMCNNCHGAQAAATDHVLSPLLQPGS